MQTPKESRNGSSEMPQRTPPSTKSSQKSSPTTNRIARPLKVAGSGSGSIASPNSLSKTPKKRSPKVLERGSPRSPMNEKHTPSKLSELEYQLSQLEAEFKKAKDQLILSETLKQRTQQESEETKKQLLVMSARLEESQQQLMELSTCEDSRVQELRKLSQERDRVWQSELEAIQKQHSMDSAALASALNEIQKLKRQLEKVAESEATQSMHAETAHSEIENLRVELSETFSLVESMRKQLNDCKGSEAHALQVAREAQMQLEETMKSAESLRSEGLKAKEAYNSLMSELEQSKGEVTLLENMVRKLKEDLETKSQNSSEEIMPKEDGEDKKGESGELEAEINSLKLEIDQLKSALEASELRYEEEYIQSTLQIRNAYDQVERAKADSCAKVAELEEELKKAKGAIEELKSETMTKKTIIKDISENNKELSIKIEEYETSPKKSELEVELKKLNTELQDLKEALLDKETQFQHTTVENEMLKAEIQKREESSQKNNEAAALAEAAKAAERDALVKLGCVTEEADKSSQRATRVAEQLDAAQTANAGLEAELRRLKVQSDQWRKAAEAAANMLSAGSNGKFVDRTISLDSGYNTLAAKMDSPLSDDMDDDSPKKKNGNMLKKIGVLWKKGQK
ncbi:interactor of constitutive active ROPs 2, chloroplastic-like isoform X1 [Chenopodium quinoa]|uniref:interactor of constitutive active ROPs 2, chloroplastic-like isoform X1 n=2 Tax=Chenopodium quinoa TaxID=63459 RepID=UPI000B79A534|nr:interactor of constitutive active ROPs 2, chloroplastic-like isoform X1 [Chenopodium quinoa]XP_021751583.1 interactor of constitutive active ROPs 2, chloroplastic-like isoform X1 [Chenopodium quinoa]